MASLPRFQVLEGGLPYYRSSATSLAGECVQCNANLGRNNGISLPRSPTPLISRFALRVAKTHKSNMPACSALAAIDHVATKIPFAATAVQGAHDVAIRAQNVVGLGGALQRCIAQDARR